MRVGPQFRVASSSRPPRVDAAAPPPVPSSVPSGPDPCVLADAPRGSDAPDPSLRRVALYFFPFQTKSGLVGLARGLAELSIELVASGGTADALQQAGLAVVEVAELTGSAEMLGGRVKTLHPKIHGGILARRDRADDAADLERHGIPAIDLVVVNLYPFEQTVAKAGVTRAEAVEKIDIGGPSMIRSCAKNHAFTAVLVDPADYAALLDELRASGGALGEATRRRLALKAFGRTAAYDAAIHGWLAAQEVEGDDALFPPRLQVDLPRVALLRYGENPHQRAALYGRFLELVDVLHGKALSYNNVVDVQAALALIGEFDARESAACAILKHNTPCGAGTGASVREAWQAALATDRESPFGGIVVVNRALDLATAREVDEIFSEVLVAPSFDADALVLLQKKKNRRLLRFHADRIDRTEADWKKVYGGVLVREAAALIDDGGGARRHGAKPAMRALGFAWASWHVKATPCLRRGRPHAGDRRRRGLRATRACEGRARAQDKRSRAACWRATRSSVRGLPRNRGRRRRARGRATPARRAPK